jgi:glucosamine kinase
MECAIGVDGGGTGCRVAILSPSGMMLGSGTGGPSNIATNFEGALANIRAAIAAAAAQAGVRELKTASVSAVLGLAGANVGDHAKNLVAQLGFARCEVVSDALISLDGALAGKDGTGAMIGTGSVFASRKDDVFRALGGWGFQVGDQASGARIGRSVLQETLLAHDGIRAHSDLTRAMIARFGSAAAVTEFARQSAPSEFAALAPLVVDAGRLGDAVALDILDNAMTYICKALDVVSFDAALPVVMIGGLSQILTPFLPEPLKRRIVKAQGNALDGASRLAVRLLIEGSLHA